MGKFILFSLNLIFLVTYKFFFGGEVLVSQDFPSQIASGETFTIEVTIEKGEREGFAKWQQELPEGFIASAVQTAGATFSFKKNTVKLIWMALPENENFTISYEVRTDPSLNASYELSGKFSYIDENKRRDINCDVKKINIGAGGPAMAAKEEPKNEVKKEEIKEETPVAEEKKEVSSGAAVAAVPTPKKEEPKQAKSGVVISNTVATTEDVKVERTINVMNDGSYVVNLVIDKKNYESFGKVEEYIPTGFVASELKNDEGMFSFNNNVMKILWMALPPKSTLEVSYKLRSTSDELDSATVHGVFSFLRGEESVQLAMKGSRFPNNFMMEEEKEEMKVEEPIAAVTPADPEPTKKEQLEKEVTSMPSPERISNPPGSFVPAIVTIVPSVSTLRTACASLSAT